MKRFFLTLCALCATTALWAATATVNGITLTYSVSSGKATITDCNLSASGTLEIPSTLGGYPVTAIGFEAFFGCSGLTSVTIPSSVTSIGNDAFSYCESLTSVTIPEGVTSIGSYAFRDCTGLTSVTIPSSVTSIGNSAFSNCSGLTSVTIPEGVTSIGDDAFWYCTGLTSITIPSSVTSIGEWAFYHCESLTSILFEGEPIESVGYGAFPYSVKGYYYARYEDAWSSYWGSWNNLTMEEFVDSNAALFSYSVANNEAAISGFQGESPEELVIPAKIDGWPVTTIENYVFFENYNLTSVVIPETVTLIGSYAFVNTSIRVVIFEGLPPSNVADYAFGECCGYYVSTYATEWESVITDGKWKNLAMQEVTNGKTETDVSFFSYVISDGKVTVTGLKNYYHSKVVIPSEIDGCPVVAIGNSAFAGSAGLISIAIPNSVTAIGDRVFDDCPNLYKDENGVQYESAAKVVLIKAPSVVIGEFIIPSSVRFVQNYPFLDSDCTELTLIDIPASASLNWQALAFRFAPKLKIVVDERNPLYASQDGALFTKDMKTIIRGPGGTGAYVIPSSVTELASYSFFGCSQLTSVTIPNSVVEVGDYCVFSNCSSLTSMIIPESIAEIKTGMFSGCTSLVSVVLPSTLTYIGRSVFEGCTSLTSVAIPSNVPLIGDRAFSGCSGLTSVTIPEGVTSIGNRAFYNCSSLTSVTIPSSLASIGNSAFENCTSLDSVNFLGAPPETSGNSVFPKTVGTFLGGYISEWECVVDANGKWNNVDFSNSFVFKIVFEANGGIGGKTLTVSYGAALSAPTVTREGYTFMGWEPAVPATVPASNGTYTAQWGVNQYTITFDANGGQGGTSVTLDYGTAVSAPSVTREGYTFIGWIPEIPAEVPAKDTTYTAQWQANVYTITFDANGGEGGTTVTQDYGTALAAPIVTREGYTFVGWMPDVPSTVPAENATYVAQWVDISSLIYTIENGKVTIIGLQDNYPAELEIPEVIHGCPVTTIAASAFENCTNLTSIIIPESVTFIGEGAFSGCTNITAVKLPIVGGSVPGFYEACFTNHNPQYSLDTEVSLFENNPAIVQEASKLYASSVPSYTMYVYGTYMYFEGGVTYYFSAGYDDHSSVKVDSQMVIAPSSTECQVGTGDITFETSGWHWIDLRASNYAVHGGANTSTLNGFYWWTSADTTKRRFVTSDTGNVFSVTTSLSLAEIFPDCYTSIQTVEVIGSSTEIPEKLFAGCSSLQSITIPSTVTSIGVNIFDGCDMLESVTGNPNVAKLDFDSGEGTFNGYSNTKFVVLGQPYGLLPVPKHDTLIFAGWKTESGVDITSESICATTDGDTLVATWRDALYDEIEIDLNTLSDYMQSGGTWTEQSSTTYDGVSAFKSGTISHSGNTSITRTVNLSAESTLSFYWKVSSESNYDYLRFYIDDVEQDRISGSTSWALKEYTLPAGTHILKWAYTKDGSDSKNSDCGWVDCISLVNAMGILENQYAYTIRNNDLTFIGCNGGMPETLAIPTRISGQPVVAIGDNAFKGYTELTSVEIPATIESIGVSAFEGCENAIFYFEGGPITNMGNSAFPETQGFYNQLLVDAWEAVAVSGKWHNLSMAPITPSSVLEYSILNDQVVITGINDSSITVLLLPSVIEGHPVTSIGNRAFYNCSGLTSVSIPSSVTSIGDEAFYNVAPTTLTAVKFPGYGMSKNNLKTVTIPEGVTSIGYAAFSGCSGLTSITIPSSVTSVGDWAFSDCSGLTSITIPDSVTSIGDYAFYNCSSLTSVTIPSSVTSIGSSAFSGCSGLTSVTIPSSVTSIGNWAFQDCRSLTSVTIPEGVTSIGYAAFSGCSGLTSITIPSSVTSVGEEAFLGVAPKTLTAVKFPGYGMSKNNLKTVTIPEGVTSIGNYAFDGCSSLTSVAISEGVTSIGLYAFSNCSGLTSVSIPSSMTSIGNGAFSYCFGLTSITIPSSVTSIGNDAFSGCSSLNEVHISDVESWCAIVFSNYDSNPLRYAKNLYLNGTLVTDLVIPEGVTSIGNRAFYNCSDLTSVMIPSSVASIGSNAFSGVAPTTLIAAWVPSGMSRNNLTMVIIPDRATSIPNSAFSDCSKLTSITIPSSVTSIGDEAFYGCSTLKKVIFLGTPPEGIGSNSFEPIRFYYPATSADLLNKWTAVLESLDSWNGSVFVSYNRMEEGALYQTLGGAATLVGTYETLSASVRIPERLGNRYVVTEINAHAFDCQKEMQTLTLSKYIETIGAFAFRDCSMLASVEFLGAPPTVGSNAFTTAKGYYWQSYASKWSAEIADDGTWENLAMNVLFESADGLIGEERDGGIIITGCNTDRVGRFEIPSEISGTPVVAIAPAAFINQSEITEIIIPEGVTSIGGCAFEGCFKVVSVQLPSTLKEVGTDAFKGVQPETLIAAWVPSGMSSESLTKLTVPAGVTVIPEGAFTNCTAIEELILPVGLESVASDAFSGVAPVTLTADRVSGNMTRTHIETLMVPKGVAALTTQAFMGCTSLTSVELPETVKKIGTEAFKGCNILPKIVLPESITEIGSSAFYNCTALTSPVFPSTLQTIGPSAFRYCEKITKLAIPNGVTSVGASAFAGCSDIEEVVLTANVPGSVFATTAFTNVSPKRLTAGYIPADMVRTGITTVRIPEGTRAIPANAFKNCTSLITVSIPDSVTTIGANAFYGCTAWRGSLSLPEGLLSIGAGAFYNCRSLTGKLVIPDGVTTIPENAFYGCTGFGGELNLAHVTSIGTDAFKGIEMEMLTATHLPSGMLFTKLTGVVIPDGTEAIPANAFKDCDALVSVMIPSSVTTIGANAFSGCSSWAGELLLPEGLTMIGAGAFRNCASLTGELKLPDGLTSLPDDAFNGCSEFTGVLILPDGLVSLGVSAFAGCSGFTGMLNIPLGLTTVSTSAFAGCTGVEGLSSLAHLTQIGANAFDGCTGVQGSLILAANVAVGTNAFRDVAPVAITARNLLGGVDGEQLETIVVPTGITTLAEGAFAGCTLVKKVSLPATLVTVGEGAFADVAPTTVTAPFIPGEMTRSSITSLTITPGITSVKNAAFKDCTAIKSVELPDSLEIIGNQAFYGCSSLTAITIPAKISFMGEHAFSTCSALTSVTFEGLPPEKTTNTFVFDDFGEIVYGYYPEALKTEWEFVLVWGYWDNLLMDIVAAGPTLPEGMDAAVGDWLQEILAGETGTVVLDAATDNPTTAEDLDAARLLGVTPNVSVDGEAITVAVKTTFEVSSLTVANNKVSLVATVTVGQGQALPETITLGGSLKVKTKESLAATWTDTPLTINNPDLTRVDDNTYQMQMEIDLSNHKFYQVIVE